MGNKIFFAYRKEASWLDRDKNILSSHFDLVSHKFATPSSYLNPQWLSHLLKSDLLFIWFASLYFFPLVLLAKLLGKKIIVVSGGFDVANVPEISYGGFTGPVFLQWFRKKIFAWSDKVLCVSQSNLNETILNAKAPAKKCTLIYHGFEPIDLTVHLNDWKQRSSRIVMIAMVNQETFVKKGIDQFLKLSSMMPNHDFVLVGSVTPDLQELFKRTAPSNFSYPGFMQFRGPEFNALLNSSRYILQLSYHESFGASVIDGALMGCYPIVTSQYALPEVAKGIGGIVTYGKNEEVKELIEKLDQADIDCQAIALAASERFSLEKRVKSLIESVRSELSDN